MAHAQEVFANDVEVGVGQQMVDVGDAPRDRVLDGNHGKACFARLHRLQHIFKGWTGNGVQIGEGLAASEVRIGAWLALVGDAFGGRLIAGCGHLGTGDTWRATGSGIVGGRSMPLQTAPRKPSRLFMAGRRLKGSIVSYCEGKPMLRKTLGLAHAHLLPLVVAIALMASGGARAGEHEDWCFADQEKTPEEALAGCTALIEG